MEEAWAIVEVDERWQPRPVQRIEIWIPKVEIWRMVDGEMACSMEQVLPGYVLVRFSGMIPQDAELALRARLLRGPDGRLAMMAGKELEWLQECEESSVVVGLERFEFGEPVRVREGARSSLVGMSGKFIASMVKDGHLLAFVDINLFGVRWECEAVYYDQVERIGADSQARRGRRAGSGSNTAGTWTEFLRVLARKETRRAGRGPMLSRSCSSYRRRNA